MIWYPFLNPHHITLCESNNWFVLLIFYERLTCMYLTKWNHLQILVSPQKMELVFFRLPGHGNMTLKHMNSLRSRQHFCDITIVASNNQTFRGHKVVLAACSPFLRDQFLLNPSSRLQVGPHQHMWDYGSRLNEAVLCSWFFSRCRCCTAPQWCVICFSLATLESCSSTQRRS